MKLQKLLFSIILLAMPVLFVLPSKYQHPPTSEDIYYASFKWQFIDEKILDEIEREENSGLGLFFAKWLATIPSMWFASEALQNKDVGTNVGLAAVFLMLREVVKWTGQHYKTKAAQFKVLKNIANNIAEYEQYIPPHIVPLFVKMRDASDSEIEIIIPRIMDELKSEVFQALPGTRSWKAIKRFIGWCIGRSFDTGFFAIGYAAGVAGMYYAEQNGVFKKIV